MTNAVKLEAIMKYKSQETQIALLSQSLDHMHETLQRIEGRFGKIETEFTNIDKKLDDINNKTEANFKWLVGTIISLFILNGLMPALAHMLGKVFTR